MTTENTEARLQTIVEFIEKHKTQERRIQLQTFYGESAPTTLVSWNDTGFTTPWFFTTHQVEIAFSEALLCLGEAVGFCERERMLTDPLHFSSTKSNYKGDGRFMGGFHHRNPRSGRYVGQFLRPREGSIQETRPS